MTHVANEADKAVAAAEKAVADAQDALAKAQEELANATTPEEIAAAQARWTPL